MKESYDGLARDMVHNTYSANWYPFSAKSSQDSPEEVDVPVMLFMLDELEYRMSSGTHVLWFV